MSDVVIVAAIAIIPTTATVVVGYLQAKRIEDAKAKLGEVKVQVATATEKVDAVKMEVAATTERVAEVYTKVDGRLTIALNTIELLRSEVAALRDPRAPMPPETPRNPEEGASPPP